MNTTKIETVLNVLNSNNLNMLCWLENNQFPSVRDVVNSSEIDSKCLASWTIWLFPEEAQKIAVAASAMHEPAIVASKLLDVPLTWFDRDLWSSDLTHLSDYDAVKTMLSSCML